MAQWLSEHFPSDGCGVPLWSGWCGPTVRYTRPVSRFGCIHKYGLALRTAFQWVIVFTDDILFTDEIRYTDDILCCGSSYCILLIQCIRVCSYRIPCLFLMYTVFAINVYTVCSHCILMIHCIPCLFLMYTVFVINVYSVCSYCIPWLFILYTVVLYTVVCGLFPFA